MSFPDFKAMLDGNEYAFLRENDHLGKRIMLLGLSGSYGYGTNREGSNVDFRGVAMQQPSDILVNRHTIRHRHTQPGNP